MPSNTFLSIIIPTFNEAESISLILNSLIKVLEDLKLPSEIIVVDDDSKDNTSSIAESVLGPKGRVVVRKNTEKGLSLSVLEGIRQSQGAYIIVMDADGSHPPETIKLFLEKINQGVDLVVASRYVKGGGSHNFPFHRKIISRFACLLGRLVTDINDNTSGFFCIRKSCLDNCLLEPKGFKIGLEIFVKAKINKKCEVPFIFLERKKGKSKLGNRQVFEYLVQIMHLLKYRMGL